MEHDQLKIQILSCTNGLLEIAKKCCWNTVSTNVTYILSDFNEFKSDNYLNQRKLKQQINSLKEPVKLDSVVTILHKEYHDLYDVTLYIFRSLKKETIVEIEFYRKSNFEMDYLSLVKDNLPMFHSKISRPVYSLEGGKFDVNWESGKSIHHKWKNFFFRTFLYRYKIRGKNYKL